MALDPEYVNPYVEKIFPVVNNFVAGGGTRTEVHTFVGFLGAEEDTADGQVRKLYSDPALEGGFEIRVADIRYNALTPKSPENGLKRDVVFVRSDAIVTHFSKRRPRSNGPRGGSGEDTGGGGHI